MLAKLATTIPRGDYLYEPKWDGFRALVFVGASGVYIQSRGELPLARYFPELVPCLERLPMGVYDGEIVIRGSRGLDFEALQMRLHPAASRVTKLAAEIPAIFVAFDLLASGPDDVRALSQVERQRLLARALAGQQDVRLTPQSRDPAVATDWFHRFEGAGLDGVIAKPLGGAYQPGVRAMIKVKHQRTADCVVAGFRWHKNGPGTHIGSLILGLFDAAGGLHHVGVAASFTMSRRKGLAEELEPLRADAFAGHPWRDWLGDADAMDSPEGGVPGGASRWSGKRDLRWEPLRLERVCEVRYDHLQGARFRHATHFLRWRSDKDIGDCTYSQLEVVAPAELDALLGASVNKS